MVKFNFIYKKKKISIDVNECRSIFSKARGLMFKKKSKPLLFVYDYKTSEAIHSFFCLPFVAIWLDDEKIIDIKYVKPWRIYIKPSKKFDKLLEIPVGNKEFKMFLDGIRKV